ncbi:META domain-containing protein [Novosphingobium panipatense]|jgi:heat shock protein HslJ|uniref:META domain-containing protein n=1 Tax=Novosphingobium TaxID=165696 RepID=UPI000CDAEA58|nr:META domain-containing protein [Novosphingobium sp. HII-3]
MQRLAPLLLWALLATGCSDTGEHSISSHRGPASESLASGTWHFVRIDGERPASKAARLSFEGPDIVVHAGCNRFEGPWRLEQNRLLAGPFAQSDAPCSKTSWEQGNALGALLVAAPTVTAEGSRIVLRSSGHTAELVRVD